MGIIDKEGSILAARRTGNEFQRSSGPFNEFFQRSVRFRSILEAVATTGRSASNALMSNAAIRLNLANGESAGHFVAVANEKGAVGTPVEKPLALLRLNVTVEPALASEAHA